MWAFAGGAAWCVGFRRTKRRAGYKHMWPLYASILGVIGFVIGIQAHAVVGLALAAVGAYLGWKIGAAGNAYRAQMASQAAAAATRPSESTRCAPSDEDRIRFYCAVSGESFYQENIRRVAAVGKDVDLVPEPENPHDKNAVRVDVDGLQIGYIPRDKAEQAWAEDWKAIIAAVNSGSKATGIVLGITETYRDKPRPPISEKPKRRKPKARQTATAP